MNRKVIFGDYGQLSCPYCQNTLIECQQDYERCYTPIQAEYEWEDRGTPYDMILKNKWYIPEDDYNQRIEYCSGCGKKLNWKDFFIANYKKYNGLNEIKKEVKCAGLVTMVNLHTSRIRCISSNLYNWCIYLLDSYNY